MLVQIQTLHILRYISVSNAHVDHSSSSRANIDDCTVQSPKIESHSGWLIIVIIIIIFKNNSFNMQQQLQAHSTHSESFGWPVHDKKNRIINWLGAKILVPKFWIEIHTRKQSWKNQHSMKEHIMKEHICMNREGETTFYQQSMTLCW